MVKVSTTGYFLLQIMKSTITVMLHILYRNICLGVLGTFVRAQFCH